MPRLKIDDKRRYSAEEAAPLLWVTAYTVKEWCRSGVIAADRIGPRRKWYIRGSEIRRRRTELNLDFLDDDGGGRV